MLTITLYLLSLQEYTNREGDINFQSVQGQELAKEMAKQLGAMLGKKMAAIVAEDGTFTKLRRENGVFVFDMTSLSPVFGR